MRHAQALASTHSALRGALLLYALPLARTRQSPCVCFRSSDALRDTGRMTCSDKTRYESTTCPQNTLKTRKHPQNVSGREAFAHFMEIMGSAVVLPLRGEFCTELRGEPGAALSCGEGTERVLPSLNPFSSRIRMR